MHPDALWCTLAHTDAPRDLCERVELSSVMGSSLDMRQSVPGCFCVCQNEFIRWVWLGVFFNHTTPTTPHLTCLIDVSMQLHAHHDAP